MEMSRYRNLFLAETREHLHTMNQLVDGLEREPERDETINALFREAHSIKGMAAAMQFTQTAAVAHHLEHYLGEIRSCSRVPPDVRGRLLDGIDLLEGLLDDIVSGRPERNVEKFLQKTATCSGQSGQDMAIVTNVDCTAQNSASQEPADSILSSASAGDHSEEFQVIIDLVNAPKSANPGLKILQRLEEMGEILSSEAVVDSIRQGGEPRQVKLWLRSGIAPDKLKSKLLTIEGIGRVGFAQDRRKKPGDDQVATVRVSTDRLDNLLSIVGELLTNHYLLQTAAESENWTEIPAQLILMDRLVENLRHEVIQARMVPFQTITGRLPKAIRDISRKSGKNVTLNLIGEDLGVDRVVLEQLGDSLLHLVRNAVDHGIVSQETLTIEARREKEQILIEVSDDGRGMSPEQIKKTAIAQGLLAANQAGKLSDREALMLICQPGFSTAQGVTETSGRGVGMDVVKSSVERLGGTLAVSSALDRGTRVQMSVPLSTAIVKVLLVACARQRLAIPITRVVRTFALPSAMINRREEPHVFVHEGRTVPLYSLAELLSLARTENTKKALIVLAEVQGGLVGLQVDSLIGQREVFVKPLHFPLDKLPGLSGVTVEGAGIIFVLEPQSLVENRLMLADKAGWKPESSTF
ncbi:MAG: chemotaxis protein CheA [Deltaproteobacteria bacterium]|jgi:two-component system chemotaxis sensor kinase CheA|nr:chemotaxis protein CheA [Deltaproteobacteria bacterium]